MGRNVCMSIDSLGSPLAFGHTAEVYQWKEGQILKLFREGSPLYAIEHEARVTRLVCQAGLSAPAVDQMIEMNGRYGLVYERVSGHPMLHTLSVQPWTFSWYTRLLAELHAEIHRVEALPGLPSQHQKLREKIQAVDILPPHVSEALLSAVPWRSRIREVADS
jgi:hypothetical protein